MFSTKFFAAFIATCLASSVLAATVPATGEDVKPEQICSRCWPALFDFESKESSAFSLVDASDSDPLEVPLTTECYYTEVENANKQTFCLYSTKTGELTKDGNPDGLCSAKLLDKTSCGEVIPPATTV